MIKDYIPSSYQLKKEKNKIILQMLNLDTAARLLVPPRRLLHRRSATPLPPHRSPDCIDYFLAVYYEFKAAEAVNG